MEIEKQVVVDSIALSKNRYSKISNLIDYENPDYNGAYPDDSLKREFEQDLIYMRKEFVNIISSEYNASIVKNGLKKEQAIVLLKEEIKKLKSIYNIIKDWKNTKEKDVAVFLCMKTIIRISDIIQTY
jgi:hypothetical protein